MSADASHASERTVLFLVRHGEAEARFPDLWKRLAARDEAVLPEGGESPAQVYARVSEATERLIASLVGQRIVGG